MSRPLNHLERRAERQSERYKVSRSRWLGRAIGALLILSAGYGFIHIAANLSHLMVKN
jgi:hypothetical protein